MAFWPLRPRQPLVGLALAAIAGINLADWVPVPLAAAALATAAAGAAALRWRRTLLCALFVGAAFFTLHTAQHGQSEARRLAELAGPAPVVAEATGIVWTEPEPPKNPGRTPRCSFELKLERVALRGLARNCEARVLMRWEGPMPAYGDRVSVLGSLHPLPPARNEGQFDYATYQQRHGIFSEITARYEADGHVESHGHGQCAQRFAFAAQRWVAGKLQLDLQDEPEISALIQSMVLGLRSETPDEVKALFQHTGTMHLFAVSGLNVAMLATIAWYLLKALRVPRRAAILIIIPLLAAYALVTGLSASCVRACVMAAFVLAAYLVDREPSPFNGVAAAVLAILAWDTNQLFSPGFQFSFALVAVLLGFANRLAKPLLPLCQPDPFLPRPLWNGRQIASAWVWRRLVTAVAVATASWIGSIFFTAWYFHLISPVTVIANLFAVPAAFAILVLAVGALLFGGISSTLAVLFNNANWLCTNGLLAGVEFFAGLPGSYVYFPRPRFESRADYEVAVLDVGNGGAAFLRTRSAAWLVDCAHGYEYERIVAPFLQARGVNQLDGLLLTHGDAQHVGGAPALTQTFRPRLVLDSAFKDRSSTRRAFHVELAARGWPKRFTTRGDTLPLGPEVRATVLFPPANLVATNADDRAMVLLLTSAAGRTLLMSDAGLATEHWLMEHEPDLRVDVVVKGEHIKDGPGGLDFLLRVAPQLVVITAPDPYAPAGRRKPWAAKVRARGIALLEQQETGEVLVRVGPAGVEVRGWLNGRETFKARTP